MPLKKSVPRVERTYTFCGALGSLIVNVVPFPRSQSTRIQVMDD